MKVKALERQCSLYEKAQTEARSGQRSIVLLIKYLDPAFTVPALDHSLDRWGNLKTLHTTYRLTTTHNNYLSIIYLFICSPSYLSIFLGLCRLSIC